jgi:Protein of unknown function (DUF3500)
VNLSDWAARLRKGRVVSSATDPSPVLPPRLQGKRYDARAALNEPFVGVTTGGEPIRGLFPVRRTGVSLEPVVRAASAFIDALDDTKQSAVRFAVDADAWRAWHNIHPNLMRHGVMLADMHERQRDLALDLVRASTSAAGFTLARDVMKLNDYLGQISGEPDEFGEWLYWMSIMGEPSAAEPWGWQIDGHHVIINCFILGDQIVLTPEFLGSEPVYADTGTYAGTRVFAEEEARGYALMEALAPEQRERATLGTQLPVDVFAGSTRDNLVLPHEGISYGDLTPPQQQLLLDVIACYVSRIRPGHAEIRMDEVREHLPETRFAWIGHVDAQSPFYYRVHSPVILIEFDHQAGTVFGNDVPNRDHIHTLVRTPNGNDYGRDLLRAHYEQHDHSHPHTPHRRGLV